MKSLFGFAVLFFSFDNKNKTKKLEFFHRTHAIMLCHFHCYGTKVDIMQNLDELIFR